MDKNKIAELRSLGESHLYMAVCKVDNKITDDERVSAYFYAKRAQSILDLLELDPIIKESIVDHIKQLMDENTYELWDSTKHLDEAYKLFKQCKNLGDHTVNLICEKHISGLYQVAEVDSYLYIESKFLNKLKEQLGNL